MDQIFDLCVQLLYVMADAVGMTYKEINVWIFCIVWPVLTVGMALWIMMLRRDVRRMQGSLGNDKYLSAKSLIPLGFGVWI